MMLRNVVLSTAQHRDSTVAQVNEWLGKADALRIFKLVNANGGVTYVDDNREQLKMVFPSIHLSLSDPRKIFGIIIDKDKGWILCEFNLNKNNQAKSMISGIIYEIGFEQPVNLSSTLFRHIKATNDPNAISNLANIITVLIRITPDALAS